MYVYVCIYIYLYINTHIWLSLRIMAEDGALITSLQ